MAMTREQKIAEIRRLREEKRKAALAPQEPQGGISILESLVRGAGQGASLGFADEITGAVEAATDPSSYTDLDQALANYQQSREESRQAYDAAQAANPKAFMTGNIGGAVATSLIPVGAAARAGAGLGKLMAQGAAVGGAAGLGESEADLTKGEIGGALKDTAIGGAMGAGATGIIGGTAKLGSAALNRLSQKQVGQDFSDIYRATRRGEKLAGEDVLRDINQQQMGIAKDVIEEAQGRKSEMGNLYKQFYRSTTLDDAKATQEALRKLQSNVAEASRNPIIKEQRNALLKYLEQEAMNPNINAKRLKEIKDELEIISSEAFRGNNQQFMTQFNALMEKANPNYFKKLNDINAQYTDYMELLGGLRASTGENFSTALNKDATAVENLRQMFSKTTQPTTQSYNKLNRLSEQSPRLKESMPEIQQLARKQELNKILSEGGAFKGTVGDVALGTAEVMNKLEKLLNKVGANSQLGQKIQKYMTSPDMANKGYYLLQQQSWARDLMKDEE